MDKKNLFKQDLFSYIDVYYIVQIFCLLLHKAMAIVAQVSVAHGPFVVNFVSFYLALLLFDLMN